MKFTAWFCLIALWVLAVICFIISGICESLEDNKKFEAFVQENGTKFQTRAQAEKAFQKLKQEKAYKVWLEKIDSAPKLTEQTQKFEKFLKEHGSGFQTVSEAWAAFKKCSDSTTTGQASVQMINEASRVFQEFQAKKKASQERAQNFDQFFQEHGSEFQTVNDAWAAFEKRFNSAPTEQTEEASPKYPDSAKSDIIEQAQNFERFVQENGTKFSTPDEAWQAFQNLEKK